MKLFLGGIPRRTDPHHLRALLAQYGHVVSVERLRHANGKPRPYAFAEMDDAGARAAIAALHDKRVIQDGVLRLATAEDEATGRVRLFRVTQRG